MLDGLSYWLYPDKDSIVLKQIIMLIPLVEKLKIEPFVEAVVANWFYAQEIASFNLCSFLPCYRCPQRC